MLRFSFIAILFLAVIACDRVKDPYEGIERDDDTTVVIIDTTDKSFCGIEEYDSELNDTIYNDSLSKFRKVLLEEFTGHLCGFCPPQSKKLIAKSEDELEGKSVVMSIHAANFAALVRSKGYVTDFTTEEGDDLHDRYKGGYSAPSLMMNRSNIPASANKWDLMLDSLNNSGYYDNPVVKFNVRNIYNESIKKGKVDIGITFLQEQLNKNFTLGVYITEDNIIAKQKWYNNDPEDVPDYNHRHAIRTAITPTFGRSLASGNFTVDQQENVSFCYDIADEWNSEKCTLVIFIGDAQSSEIYQVDEISVTSK